MTDRQKVSLRWRFVYVAWLRNSVNTMNYNTIENVAI
jgi:hypothetical protein